MSEADRAFFRHRATVAHAPVSAILPEPAKPAVSAKPKRRRAPEEQIQRLIVQWWALKWRELGAADERLLMHIPNGAHKTPAQRGVFKALGLRAGVPDLLLAVARRGVPFSHCDVGEAGLWLELKAEKGRTTPAQESLHEALHKAGYVVVVCHGFDEAVAAIETWMRSGRFGGEAP
jgi:hypothetical protein